MKIDKDVLKDLNPCADRYKNFLKHNADFSGSLSEFMDLPTVAYSDKIWVAKRVLNKNQAVSWATLCAESVVHMFEEQHLDDKRPRDCIDFLKSVNDFDSLTVDQALGIKRHEEAANAVRFTAFHATNAVSAANATEAAAACAANYVDYFAEYAVQAAHYAIEAATYASDSINSADKEKQEALNIKFLKQVID